MKNKILCVALAFVMLAALIPFGAIGIPAQAENEPDPYKNEKVEVPEGWIKKEIDNNDDI